MRGNPKRIVIKCNKVRICCIDVDKNICGLQEFLQFEIFQNRSIISEIICFSRMKFIFITETMSLFKKSFHGNH